MQYNEPSLMYSFNDTNLYDSRSMIDESVNFPATPIAPNRNGGGGSYRTTTTPSGMPRPPVTPSSVAPSITLTTPSSTTNGGAPTRLYNNNYTYNDRRGDLSSTTTRGVRFEDTVGYQENFADDANNVIESMQQSQQRREQLQRNNSSNFSSRGGGGVDSINNMPSPVTVESSSTMGPTALYPRDYVNGLYRNNNNAHSSTKMAPPQPTSATMGHPVAPKVTSFNLSSTEQYAELMVKYKNEKMRADQREGELQELKGVHMENIRKLDQERYSRDALEREIETLRYSVDILQEDLRRLHEEKSQQTLAHQRDMAAKDQEAEHFRGELERMRPSLLKYQESEKEIQRGVEDFQKQLVDLRHHSESELMSLKAINHQLSEQLESKKKEVEKKDRGLAKAGKIINGLDEDIKDKSNRLQRQQVEMQQSLNKKDQELIHLKATLEKDRQYLSRLLKEKEQEYHQSLSSAVNTYNDDVRRQKLEFQNAIQSQKDNYNRLLQDNNRRLDYDDNNNTRTNSTSSSSSSSSSSGGMRSTPRVTPMSTMPSSTTQPPRGILR
ncbi:hypothetical protein SAMD00019534_101710 [Acytostelium subglobosum LB1]|uniref:hypothetical protein n=1 Tax=Acytostelium subglobosum LB1 TaxID=1410327 RepID=UPI000644A20A|nr:hypothetical protein SAMD00019534_101710 [Acytostelium subglobosum LB1]GAM26996.1 hypothetical protein SAMD00019534_101710 [Acytostelium subglobosum LB1]|eukprot:XP_012749876.1 hypothetical protein SAMD00019534_101710 [Acytostelium subglobosum LB1]